MNWDDLKYFLSVCRNGSIRAAAKALGVNHATVSRRINSFEEALGERLFERTSQGYVRTTLADELYQDASHLEERLSAVERKVAGKDETLQGDIRVTMPDVLAQDLLMPHLAAFCEIYPKVELDIVDSTRKLNLANREADVAFRLCDQPPAYLIGRQLVTLYRACYIAQSSAHKLSQSGWLEKQNWIGWSDKLRRPIGKIARDYPRFVSRHKIISATLQAAACRNGLGVAILPCFLGDPDPTLVRIPPFTSEAKYKLWILSHPDSRNNVKIRTFVSFMTERLMLQRPLIEGETYQPGAD